MTKPTTNQAPVAAHQAELKMALELHRSGAFKEAAAMYQLLLKSYPKNFDLNHYMGMALIQLGQPDQAIRQLKIATQINPQSVAALSNLAVAYQALGQAENALSAFDKAIELRPDLHDPHARKAALFFALSRFDDAAASFEAALALKPSAALYNDYGVTLRELGRYEDALIQFDHALALQPDYVAASVNRGNVHGDLKDYHAAIQDYDRVLAFQPDHREALQNKADALKALQGGENSAEVEGLQRAAQQGRSHAENTEKTNRVEGALLSYARAAAERGGMSEDTRAMRIHVMHQLCDWSEDSKIEEFLEDVRARKLTVDPFALIALPATAQDQMVCAQQYAQTHYPLKAPVWTGETYQHDKIRVAYLSSDFHTHATAFLMAALFENHDRIRFQWIALSSGGNDQSPMRARLEAAFDQFIDISKMNDDKVAQWVRNNEVDIIVDLKGYTKDNRFGVLTRRCAPVQITYLGYPGTTASQAVDYMIADRDVVPSHLRQYFTEKIVYMPNSYQVNDDQRPIATDVPARAQLGLPEKAFVFCSFNHTYKITPDMYDVWMRILARVPHSVLWLYKPSKGVVENLHSEAEKRGIDPQRIVFAEFAKQAEHLARLSQADLFLDNLPCNAHTTASDALWAGLPVLTCPGETFAGRVASSLLHAVDMPELIVPTLAAYEEAAIDLALDPNKLKALRDKLQENRTSKPLFDTALFAKQLEAAYLEVYQRQHAGQPPEDIFVTA